MDIICGREKTGAGKRRKNEGDGGSEAVMEDLRGVLARPSSKDQSPPPGQFSSPHTSTPRTGIIPPSSKSNLKWSAIHRPVMGHLKLLGFEREIYTTAHSHVSDETVCTLGGNRCVGSDKVRSAPITLVNAQCNTAGQLGSTGHRGTF
ncbi:unnamed protein product [Pleuronectes platessa]|uniref:Uncharacterized protein n=1 Tax=Pleuronectes platessa TaxID=8262 RepID=A0A9N7VBW9_PLEPL|nr:unnamed protein product [Pleuronectes platessa]